MPCWYFAELYVACASAVGVWGRRGLPLYLEQLYNDVNLLLQTTWLILLLAGAPRSTADLNSLHTQTRPRGHDIGTKHALHPCWVTAGSWLVRKSYHPFHSKSLYDHWYRNIKDFNNRFTATRLYSLSDQFLPVQQPTTAAGTLMIEGKTKYKNKIYSQKYIVNQ